MCNRSQSSKKIPRKVSIRKCFKATNAEKGLLRGRHLTDRD
jgi:hypothetical protein